MSYLQETVQLEMKGPAHKLATENGFTEFDFGNLMGAFPQVQGKLIEDQLGGAERVVPAIWPWPDLTSTEIIDQLKCRPRYNTTTSDSSKPTGED